MNNGVSRLSLSGKKKKVGVAVENEFFFAPSRCSFRFFSLPFSVSLFSLSLLQYCFFSQLSQRGIFSSSCRRKRSTGPRKQQRARRHSANVDVGIDFDSIPINSNWNFPLAFLYFPPDEWRPRPISTWEAEALMSPSLPTQRWEENG